MDRQRTVAGLDLHKDTIYFCVMSYDEAIILKKHTQNQHVLQE